MIQRVEGGESPDRLAVLARTNADVGRLALQLLARGTNARVLGGGNILKSRIAQDMIAWVQAVEAPTEEAWMRVYRTPSRYLRKVPGRRRCGTRPGTGATSSTRSAARRPARPELATLCQDLRNLRRKQGTLSLPPGLRRKGDLGPARQRREAVGVLPGSPPERGARTGRPGGGGARGACRRVPGAWTTSWRSRPLRATRPRPAVTLSTMHRAKGLEWPIVYVLAEARQGAAREGRPRRGASALFYVAVTRAEEELHCVFEESPSSYIDIVLDPQPQRSPP